MEAGPDAARAGRPRPRPDPLAALSARRPPGTAGDGNLGYGPVAGPGAADRPGAGGRGQARRHGEEGPPPGEPGPDPLRADDRGGRGPRGPAPPNGRTLLRVGPGPGRASARRGIAAGQAGEVTRPTPATRNPTRWIHVGDDEQAEPQERVEAELSHATGTGCCPARARSWPIYLAERRGP